MTIALVFLALILATLLGWLLKQSFNTQPWVAETVGETAHHGPLGTNSRLIALLAFLAVVSSFFALILSAYALRMELGDCPAAPAKLAAAQCEPAKPEMDVQVRPPSFVEYAPDGF